MYKWGEVWVSEFPPVRGEVVFLDGVVFVVAVTSYHSLTGGHAAIYMEGLLNGTPQFWKVHLTAGVEGSQRLEMTGSGSSASGSGTNKIDINYEQLESEYHGRSEHLHYQSWEISNNQWNAVIAAAERFRNKAEAGRYTYRLAGGVAGWLSTMPGKRGVNCADFCIKILKEAGIANLGNSLINTPKRVAGA